MEGGRERIGEKRGEESPLTRKEGVRGGQLSAFFQSAASAVVGIGLLVGSTGEVQAACDPPVFDVCTH